MMNRHREQRETQLLEIVTALRDLARFSLSHGSTPMERFDTTLKKLLVRLMALCDAQRGAVFLISSSSSYTDALDQPLALDERSVQACAVHNMQKEGALALLTSFPRQGIQVLPSSDTSGWMLWRSRVDLPFPASPTVPAEKKPGETAHSQQLLFVFGWEDIDQERWALLTEKGMAILPFMEDAVGAVITQVLLIERMQELETGSDQKDVEDMEFFKAEMLASVGHELRSPLASMKGYATTLLRHEQRISHEERHEFLVTINESCDRLARVVASFLEMSELETDSMVMHYTSINIERLVREAIIAIEQRLGVTEQTEHQRERETRSAVPGPWIFDLHLIGKHGKPTPKDLIIQADPRRLREVLDQLLENAATHAQKSGNVNVVIRPGVTMDTITSLNIPSKETERKLIEAMRKHHHMVAISVRDSGKGIEPQYLERIFDRFYQVETQLTREVNGLGLGLTMCKRIVELHSGVMWAESEFGKGSIFHVFLPMRSTEKKKAPFVKTGTQEGV